MRWQWGFCRLALSHRDVDEHQFVHVLLKICTILLSYCWHMASLLLYLKQWNINKFISDPFCSVAFPRTWFYRSIEVRQFFYLRPKFGSYWQAVSGNYQWLSSTCWQNNSFGTLWNLFQSILWPDMGDWNWEHSKTIKFYRHSSFWAKLHYKIFFVKNSPLQYHKI